MHEKTRRNFCRCGFLLFCVLPTVILLCSAAWRAMPGRLREIEARLSERLGLTVAIDKVSYPRPGTTLLSGVKLCDPETGAEVARLRLLEAVERDGGYVLIASQPEIDGQRLGRLWRLLERQLLDRPAQRPGDGASGKLRWIAGEVTLRGEQASWTFTDVRGAIEMGAEGPQAAVEFRVAGLDMPELARFRVVRNRTEPVPATRIELQTAGALLPFELLWPGGDGARRLGTRCRFRGAVWAELTPGGWQGELTGELVDVDLDRLVSEHFPHKLSGQASIVVRQARFRRGRLVQADGSFSAPEGGVISRSLIDAAADSLRLSCEGPEDARADGLVRYRQLAFGFQIESEGLTLVGQC